MTQNKLNNIYFFVNIIPIREGIMFQIFKVYEMNHSRKIRGVSVSKLIILSCWFILMSYIDLDISRQVDSGCRYDALKFGNL